MKIQTLIAAIAFTTSSVAFAQDSAPATPKLDNRQAHQQQRVDKGVASGQLTANEANRLEARQAKLASNEAEAKADGKVTRSERAKLHRQASRNSDVIHRQKHDRQRADR